jgi:heat shock protein HspQ
MVCGGEGGIRTHGTRKGTTVFETVPIDHSGTSPRGGARPNGRRLGPGAQRVRRVERGPLANDSAANKRLLAPGAWGTRLQCMTHARSHHIPAQAEAISLPPIAHARFAIGDVVRHRLLDFRGVIFDVDPVFANSEEWYQAIPEGIRPRKDQPFYHLLAQNDEASYTAYVSQQNLVRDDSDEPVDHPAIAGMFTEHRDGRYTLRPEHRH